ncbi:chorismate-binding protein [Streptomyces sp. NPDC002589]|uniref:chorismate-binding protein n=1 Tax=Streptomyces sp. NPDC002589 TaxID=3154420 RepID=UPI003328DE52
MSRRRGGRFNGVLRASPCFRHVPRRNSCCAVLACDADGTLDAALVLRSVFQEGSRCWVQAGVGIVRQSQPEREHEETCEKLRSIAYQTAVGL